MKHSYLKTIKSSNSMQFLHHQIHLQPLHPFNLNIKLFLKKMYKNKIEIPF